jgi:hypothetical protein
MALHNSATMTFVVWCEEQFCNVSAVQNYKLQLLLLLLQQLPTWCGVKNTFAMPVYYEN